MQADIGLHRAPEGERALSIAHGSVPSRQVVDEERRKLALGRSLGLDLVAQPRYQPGLLKL
jgi:hypothetical protein